MMLDLEPVQVSSLFANSLSIVREKAATRPIHLSMVAPETLGSIQADARKVKQIVYNLLSNAVKFTVEGGQVTLHASRVPRSELHCGGVAVESAVGEGACEGRRPEMATVLVIEDNTTSMKLSVLLLETAGHTVIVATDAEAGLTLARDEQPNLILMDVQLPGMDGLEATTMLKKDQATRAIPVIALTALAMKGDEERIRAAGCDGYIAKPMSYQEFLATVATQLTHNGATTGRKV
jgi:two-component system cell cycle response regulator DivK